MDKLSREMPTTVFKLASDFVNWFKSSVLTSYLARKCRMIFLTFLLWIAIPATLVTMNRTYNDLKSLKIEIPMEKKPNAPFEQNKKSADVATIELNSKLAQRNVGYAI
ncbi:hypothetical protein [Hymenobacter terrestris]|uniref:Uncharacterized protein n=1 Tax=Hymenobacter terrestris TaxID=2748310 RepID=A0ABX2Q6F4_9BACT|nr:hypothetical protein [Hymenobacter terrestris]NVO86554.1 hypothetical protein [Hymenobacter terrestris]